MVAVDKAIAAAIRIAFAPQSVGDAFERRGDPLGGGRRLCAGIAPRVSRIPPSATSTSFAEVEDDSSAKA